MARHTHITTKCLHCAAEFKTTVERQRDGHGKYCSLQCKHVTHGSSVQGGKHGRWKGISIDTEGYIVICIGNRRYRRLHCILMEWSLGRPLTADEIVHHKNEITTDNQLDNLELVSRAGHIKIHDPRNWKKSKG